MEKSVISERCYEPFDPSDLERLAMLALDDLEQLFERKPETGEIYRKRLLMLCLCQGGAEHFVRRRNGVKDLDVWAFFDEGPSRPFPYRRRGKRDFGPSHFGRHPHDIGFEGRRVDIIGRSIKRGPDQTPQHAVREWLQGRATESARLISQRPVVAIHPESLRGDIIWDPKE